MNVLTRDQLKEAEREARKELLREGWNQAVDDAKKRIKARQGRPWWVRLFPWSITITRR